MFYMDSRLKNSRNPYHRRAYASIGNEALTTTRHEYYSDAIDKKLSGFKIVHLSDLHNRRFGESQSRLVFAVKEEKPDIIVLTGDMIDRRRTDIDAAMEFIEKAVGIAPVYFVTGNHEELSGRYKEFRQRLLYSGVTLLYNSAVTLEHNGAAFSLLGIADAVYFGYSKKTGGEAGDLLNHTLKALADKAPRFKILLTHRPELIDIYSQCGIDLVICGHAHGGQVRLPFIGGLLAPGQGVFPKYTSGIYHVKNTSMAVSRGLGNSTFPLRIFNPPEIISLTLLSEII